MTDAPKIEPSDEWRRLTIRLRDESKRQISDLERTQENLQLWYAAKPGKLSTALELNECPALLRVMQTIRLLREIAAEFEKELRDTDDRAEKP
jgi:hypothetical protein